MGSARTAMYKKKMCLQRNGNEMMTQFVGTRVAARTSTYNAAGPHATKRGRQEKKEQARATKWKRNGNAICGEPGCCTHGHLQRRLATRNEQGTKRSRQAGRGSTQAGLAAARLAWRRPGWEGSRQAGMAAARVAGQQAGWQGSRQGGRAAGRLARQQARWHGRRQASMAAGRLAQQEVSWHGSRQGGNADWHGSSQGGRAASRLARQQAGWQSSRRADEAAGKVAWQQSS